MKSHHIKFQKILAVLLAILALVGGRSGFAVQSPLHVPMILHR